MSFRITGGQVFINGVECSGITSIDVSTPEDEVTDFSGTVRTDITREFTVPVHYTLPSGGTPVPNEPPLHNNSVSRNYPLAGEKNWIEFENTDDVSEVVNDSLMRGQNLDDYFDEHLRDPKTRKLIRCGGCKRSWHGLPSPICPGSHLFQDKLEF